MRIRKYSALAFFVLAALSAAPPAVRAAPIHFIYEGTASGTFDGVSFTNAIFSIDAYGDTDNRYNLFGIPDLYTIDHTSATLTIDGMGPYEIFSPTSTFANGGTVGLINMSPGADLIYAPPGGPLTGWDMLSSVGPVVGSGEYLQWDFAPLDTSGGLLQLQDGEALVTFQAIVAGGVVPEPGTLALSGIALGVVGIARTRRRIR